MQPRVVTADPIRQEMDRILESPGFARSQRLCAFLKFIVEERLEGRESGLKEAVIGTEVFGRAPDYDTRTDPVVRMEASKLRARLDEYYVGPGADDPVRIEIPKGSYVPRWQVRAPARRPGAWRWVATAAALTLIFGGFAAWRWTRAGPRQTIAVLPFLNLTSDPDNTYLSDGLADEITGLLSETEGLDVTARTSSFALRGNQLDAREIGARLTATVLVEGSLQRSGDRLKVIVQLIRTSDGKHLWSGTYERQLRELFSTEEEIATAIVGSLRLKLGGRPRHADSEAYELYLRAREALDVHSRGLALQYFERAASLDPSFAPAYAGIAEVVFNDLGQRSYAETHRRATTAVEKALALDPSLPDAYIALGEIKGWEYAFPEAERAFRRAIAVSPNEARAHVDLGYYVLAPLGRYDEAIREVQRALALDPLSFETGEFAQLTMLMAGRYQDVEKLGRQALASYSNLREAYLWLALALSFQGRHAEAMETIRAARSRASLAAGDWTSACVSVRAGQREDALRMLSYDLPPKFTKPVVNRRVFQIYSCLGDKTHAIEYAEKAYAEHDLLLPTFLSYPTTAWLRTDPAFANLRQRVGLPK